MTHWNEFQWLLYYIVQITIAICYFVIPWTIYERHRLALANNVRFVPIGETDSILFKAFILACGIHHLTHPVFMQLDFFWPMMAVDTAAAAISVMAAIRQILSVSGDI